MLIKGGNWKNWAELRKSARVRNCLPASAKDRNCVHCLFSLNIFGRKINIRTPKVYEHFFSGNIKRTMTHNDRMVNKQ